MTLPLKSICVGDTSAGFTWYWIDTEILTITQQHLLPRLAALRLPSLQQVGHRPLDHRHFFPPPSPSILPTKLTRAGGQAEHGERRTTLFTWRITAKSKYPPPRTLMALSP